MGWELTWARMCPSLQLILSLKILLKIGTGTENQRYLSSQGAASVNGTPSVSIFSTTRCPQWLHVPKHRMFLQRALPSSHCLTAFFFFEEVDTASLKRHPWFHHSFLQNCHLLLRIVLPATFSVICFIMSQCPLHSAWFSWSWCFLGRIVERKERVYKNNEAELCLKMFRITHLWIDCLERQLSKLAGELEEKEVKIIYAQQIYI